MLSSVIRHRLYLSRRVTPASVVSATVRSQSTTSVDKGKAFADDGRHEVWRDGINDHDNAPKWVYFTLFGVFMIVDSLFVSWCCWLHLARWRPLLVSESDIWSWNSIDSGSSVFLWRIADVGVWRHPKMNLRSLHPEPRSILIPRTKRPLSVDSYCNR